MEVLPCEDLKNLSGSLESYVFLKLFKMNKGFLFTMKIH